MQVGQAIQVGQIDEHGVGARIVHATLDDGGAHQHVALVAHELQHHAFQFIGRHLAVAHHDARLGHQSLDAVGRLLQALDAVVHVVHLTLAGQLALHRLLQAIGAERNHLGHDGATIGRRRGEAADVAQAQQRHVQRARDGRGGQREHIGGGAEGQQPLLVFHAEALLLIHHHQAQILEGDVLRQQSVRADDQIHLANGKIRQHLILLRRALEAAQALHAERVGAETVAEGALVLLGQHRGGHQHRHLLASAAGAEGRANGHLGLAEAHVAADQPVHRARLMHVALHRSDGGALIGRLFVGEARLEFPLPCGIGGKRQTRRGRAHGLHAQHLACEIAHRLAHALLLRLPSLAADRAQRWSCGAAADVLLDQIHARGGQVKARAAVEFQGEVFAFTGAVGVFAGLAALLQLGQLRQADVAGHAVVAVRHIVARLEGQEGVAHAVTTHALHGCAATTTRARAVKQLVLGHHGHRLLARFQPAESAAEQLSHQRHALGQSMAAQQFLGALAIALGCRGQRGGPFAGKFAEQFKGLRGILLEGGQ